MGQYWHTNICVWNELVDASGNRSQNGSITLLKTKAYSLGKLGTKMGKHMEVNCYKLVLHVLSGRSFGISTIWQSILLMFSKV